MIAFTNTQFWVNCNIQECPAFYSRQQNNKYDMLDVLYLQVHTQEGEDINVTNLMSVFEIIGQ